VTAVVGTAFGIGFALELAVPATLIAASLSAGLVARSDTNIGRAGERRDPRRSRISLQVQV
jgi:hypothetical protein